ncbi:TAFII28-domain-containing protein [Rhizoclosmatium globosum]|uniref:Transcription initiation factor TFIID subunit 11 n=1 Tax=Rhizoclosmatium globosum TaxID=329046 RepID=A0A1Y2CHK5_9FUNG|nr:TAFII28-domain-containing protein [Rhizoclosmatium globosum]|eukprot:ORY46533.1 TAFII28-domain-containing protein [Rhizoclosmatium globosum]
MDPSVPLAPPIKPKKHADGEIIPIDPLTGRPVRGKGSRGSRAARPKSEGGARLPKTLPLPGDKPRGGGPGSRGPRGANKKRGGLPGRGGATLTASSSGLASASSAIDAAAAAAHVDLSAKDGVGATFLPQTALLDIPTLPVTQLKPSGDDAVEMPPEHEQNDPDSDLNSDDDEDEDDMVDKDILIEQKTEQEKADMKALMDSFDAEQLHRFEVFRRSRLPKNSVKKVVTTMLGTTTVPANVLIAIAGTGKLFIGDIVELGREVMEEWGEEGALSPAHVREAYRRWREANRWIQT